MTIDEVPIPSVADLRDGFQNMLTKQIEDYETTLWGLVAFCSELLKNPATGKDVSGRAFRFGPTLHTSKENKMLPGGVVIPDALVLMSEELGVITEAKIGIRPYDEANSGYERTINQLRKYDDDLTGWPTPEQRINRHDIVLLTPEVHYPQFVDYLKAKVESKSDLFDRRPVVVHFEVSDRIRRRIVLGVVDGKLSDAAVNERLRVRVVAVIENLTQIYQKRFWDQKPPVSYLLETLWCHVLNTMPLAEEYLPESDKTVKAINVNVDEITKRLQETFGHTASDHLSGRPKREWVIEALQCLADWGRANETEPGTFKVEYGKIRGGSLEWFKRHEAETLAKKRRQALRAKSKRNGVQTGIFDTLPAPDDESEDDAVELESAVTPSREAEK